jgi:hypothetical protein
MIFINFMDFYFDVIYFMYVTYYQLKSHIDSFLYFIPEVCSLYVYIN